MFEVLFPPLVLDALETVSCTLPCSVPFVPFPLLGISPLLRPRVLRGPAPLQPCSSLEHPRVPPGYTPRCAVLTSQFGHTPFPAEVACGTVLPHPAPSYQLSPSGQQLPLLGREGHAVRPRLSWNVSWCPRWAHRGVLSSSEAQEHVLKFLGFSPADLHRVLHPVILDQYYT